MAVQRLRDVLEHLRRVIRPETASGLDDAQLVRRWALQRDEAAFELLMWRHGPMVLDVCQRLLRDVHAAEDAFQATFLMLARKAGSIGRREAVAGWLYRVAYRVALLARTRAGVVAPAAEQAARPVSDDVLWRDVRLVLDAEISALPARYRLPVILCYLEGKSHEQAADLLGCAVGTIASRLARAREKLRRRLVRRGLTLSAAAWAALLSEAALATTLPVHLVALSVRHAVLMTAVAASAGAIPVSVCLLMKGAMDAMTIAKLKTTAALVLGLATLTAGALALGVQFQVAQLDAAPVAEAPPQAAADAGQKEDPRAALRAMDLLREDDEYKRREQYWVKELLTARRDQIQCEEQLRLQERQHTLEREREARKLVAAEAAGTVEMDKVNSDRQQLLGSASPKAAEDPRFKARLEKLQQEAQVALDKVLQMRHHNADLEHGRMRERVEQRVLLLKAEENVRRLEREQAIQRDIAVTRLHAAAERLRQVEGGHAASSSSELERRVDRLLREVTDLRRSLEQQRTEKERARPE